MKPAPLQPAQQFSLPAMLRQFRGPLGSLVLISFASNLLMLTGSLFMLQVYDRVLPSRSVPTLIALLILVVALYALYGAIEWLRSRMTIQVGMVIEEQYGAQAFEESVRRVGTKTPDPVRDLEQVRQFVGGSGSSGLLDLPWIPIYLGLTFLLHQSLGWLVVAGGFVMCVLLVTNEYMQRTPVAKVSEAAALRSTRQEDARRGVDSIIAMGMLDGVSTRWRDATGTLARQQKASASRQAIYMSATKCFRLLLQSAVLALGAYLVIMSQASGGVMIAASILSSRALAPLEQVVAHWRGFVSARQAWARLSKTKLGSQRSGTAHQLPAPRSTLTMTGASFSPAIEAKPAVIGVGFELRAGDCLGVLGASGSGKTTLARGLVGILAPVTGQIRFDGSELSHYSPELFGRSVGYLPQTVPLFEGTVSENIGRFRADLTSESVQIAAQEARVHELITALPDGYNTKLGPGGFTLSAGQAQRIGLARALFGDPFLIVLDEPNSNLDSDGDAALTLALQRARMRGAIIVVVAHRKSAIAAANKLLVLEAGRQQHFGPRDEVLRTVTGSSPIPASTSHRYANG